MTLTLSLCSGVIGFAHYLTKRNIWVKFNENCLKGSGDMGFRRYGVDTKFKGKSFDLDLWP